MSLYNNHSYAKVDYSPVCFNILVLLIITASNKVFTAVFMTVPLCKLSFAQ
jgi:hypothetical protein